MNDGGGYKALFWVQVSEQFPSDRQRGKETCHDQIAFDFIV